MGMCLRVVQRAGGGTAPLAAKSAARPAAAAPAAAGSAFKPGFLSQSKSASARPEPGPPAAATGPSMIAEARKRRLDIAMRRAKDTTWDSKLDQVLYISAFRKLLEENMEHAVKMLMVPSAGGKDGT